MNGESQPAFGVGIIPIPDGVTANGLLRLSLVLAPSQNASGVPVSMADWPATVEAKCNTLMVSFGQSSGRPVAPPASISFASVRQARDTMWSQLFPGAQIGVLQGVLAEATQPRQPKPNSRLTRQYRAREIVATLRQIRTGALGPTLHARIQASEQKDDWRRAVTVSPELAAAHDDHRRPFRFILDRKLQNSLARSFVPAPPNRPDFTIPVNNERVPLELASAVALRQQRRAEAAIEAAGGAQAGLKSVNEDGVDTFLKVSSEQRTLMLEWLMLGKKVGTEDDVSKHLPLKDNQQSIHATERDLQDRIGLRLQLDMRWHVLDFTGAFAPARAPYAKHREAQGKVAQEADGIEEAVRTKYTGLLSHPILAKLLNFIVDVEVPIPPGVPDAGFLKVWFDKEESQASTVAYILARDSGGCVQSFRPAARLELNQSAPKAVDGLSLPLCEGMVALNPERFSLTTCDVHSLVNAMRVKYQELNSYQMGGGDVGGTSLRHPEERGRGIQLLDDDADRRVVANNEYEPKATDAIYAEALTTGYRVLVRRVDAHGRPRPWRTLMARKVRYDGIAQVYSSGPSEHGPAWLPYADAGEREHGAVRPLPREDTIDGSTDTRLVAHSHVFTWMGESLGVPAHRQDGNLVDCEQGAEELLHVGFGKEYGYPEGTDYALPPLRIGHAYQFALAPVYLHGGGPTLAQACAILAQNPGLALGGDRGFLFGRPNDVQAPVVLLSAQDPLMRNGTHPRNEHVDRVVLRSAPDDCRHERTERMVRYLAPPRLDFDAAEQYGILDGASDPEGAFTEFDMDPATGDFDSHVTGSGPHPEKVYVLRPRRDAQPPRVPYFPDPSARNVGLAFERDEVRPQGFPDVLPPLAFWSAAAGDLPAACLKARPVKLEIRRWMEARLGGRVSSATDNDELDHSGIPLSRLTLDLAPAEEVTLWVWCWPDPVQFLRMRPELADVVARACVLSGGALAHQLTAPFAGDAVAPANTQPEAMALGLTGAQFSAFQHLRNELLDVARGRVGAGNDGVSATIVGRIAALLLQPLPLNGFSGWHKIQLVHAVMKPRTVPWIQRIGRTGLEIRALRLQPGKTMLDHLGNEGNLDPDLCLHDANGTRIFFGGRVHIDRASTRALRVEASWPVLDYDVAVVRVPDPTRPSGFRYVDRPPRVDRVLFELTDIPRDGGFNGPDVVNLLRDETDRVRELRSIADMIGSSATAACELDLRLVATSRFSADFDAEPHCDSPSLGKFEVESRPYRGAGDQPSVASAKDRYLLRVPATSRPPSPVVTRVEWYAPERRWRLGEGHLMVTKHFVPRLYLDRSHRVSGEHELVGVAFLPAGAIEDQDYRPGAQASRLALDPIAPPAALRPGFADELARFATWRADQPDATLLPNDVCVVQPTNRFCKEPLAGQLEHVTRWGHDPTTGAGSRMEALISPARFSGHVAAQSEVAMPLPGAKADEDGVVTSMNVGVLLYQPQLDADIGEWYIDLAIDPGMVHAPFVRLALVRYQPFALKRRTAKGAFVDMRMSAPLLLDPFRVPAPRTVEVLHPQGQTIQVHVYGAGYRRREPFGVTDAVRHLTDMPMQTMELMRRAPAGGLLQAYAADGKPVCTERVQAEATGPLLCWRGRLEPPATVSRQQYALVIDEIEMHVPDTVLDKPGAAEPQPDTLMARPAFFSVTIELDG